MTIQKSIVTGTKEESDFDKSSAGAYEQAAVGPSDDSCSIQIPRFARNDKSFCLYKLTEHIDNTAQAEQNLLKANKKRI